MSNWGRAKIAIYIVIQSSLKSGLFGGAILQFSVSKSPFSFEKPLGPTMAIFAEFQQKLPFMASVRKMPDMPRNIMTICSCH